MNFELSEEQRMIQQSVERFVDDNYDLNTRVALSSNSPGFSTENWHSMAELGWLGLPFAKSGTAGYLASRAYTIYGGASEVQRDVIAKNVLGLTKKSTK